MLSGSLGGDKLGTLKDALGWKVLDYVRMGEEALNLDSLIESAGSALGAAVGAELGPLGFLGGEMLGGSIAKDVLGTAKNFINSYEKTHRFNVAPNKDDLIKQGSN